MGLVDAAPIASDKVLTDPGLLLLAGVVLVGAVATFAIAAFYTLPSALRDRRTAAELGVLSARQGVYARYRVVMAYAALLFVIALLVGALDLLLVDNFYWRSFIVRLSFGVAVYSGFAMVLADAWMRKRVEDEHTRQKIDQVLEVAEETRDDVKQVKDNLDQ